MYIYIITYLKKCIYIYIYRAEAWGSPEANCNLFVWIWKMLILYCVLQCFLPSLESVPSVKVSMSARINSEFVRAEKWKIYIFHGWPKMRSTSFPLELRFHTFFQFLLISTNCHNPLENHGRNEHHIFFIFAFPNLFCGMAMENVVFTLCFTVFYVFLWNGLINRSSIFIAEELDVSPCWNRKILHIPWMTKDVWNMLTIWSAVSFILVVLFRSRTCDNALENHGRNEERTFFIFMSTKTVWISWQEWEHHWFSHGAVAGRWGQSQDPDFYKYNRRLKDFYVPSGLWLLLTDLIFSAVFYLPGPGLIFQDSTSSNALHMTLLHPPPPLL